MMKDDLTVLLGDLAYVRDELQRNEEIGGKRFGIFLTLVTAVSAGLVALPDVGIATDLIKAAGKWAVVALLGLGLLTYVRMRHRNSVTDGLKGMSDALRKRAVGLCPELDVVEDTLRWPKPVGLPKWLRAGHAEVIGVIDGALFAAVLVIWREPAPYAAATAGALLAFLLWWWAIKRGQSGGQGQYFRAGAGAIIRRGDGQVLVFERTENPGAWQLPQGGLEAGEDPEKAVLREVKEETGLTEENMTQVTKFRKLLSYELPKEMRSLKTGRGQAQIWFLFDLKPGAEAKIELPKEGEFSHSKWMPFEDLVEKVVEFRRPVYRRLADWLKQY
jgi:putative (di)nucleoside polyphosphate hydrolase